MWLRLSGDIVFSIGGVCRGGFALYPRSVRIAADGKAAAAKATPGG